MATLLDDINTPLAISKMSENYSISALKDSSVVSSLLSDMRFLGLASPSSLYFGQGISGLEWPSSIANRIIDLGSEYIIAVANNDFVARDSISRELLQLKCQIHDKHFTFVSIDYFGRKGEENTIQELVNLRLAARAAKDWKESDRIRDELDAMGVSIKDNKDGTTTWEVKS
jgi:cysteinyl-tRNA synthetase